MPWKPRYSREAAADAVAGAATWADALRALGVSPLGKNYKTLRKWAERWELETSHLAASRPRGHGMRVSEDEVRRAVAESLSWTETLRRLDYCTTGNNRVTLKKYVAMWDIPTQHFDPYASQRAGGARHRSPRPLPEVLVEGSTYSRGSLKKRLYEEGLKRPSCELCGQGEIWRGRQVGLILDHINGRRDDNRIENLRIVCPNCAATLDTHCGRNLPRRAVCEGCSDVFMPEANGQRFCSHPCFRRYRQATAGKLVPSSTLGIPAPDRRKVERPPYEQLMREIEATSYLAVGRKYGVSDNAIRKWVTFYEREARRRRALAPVQQSLLDRAA